MSLEENKTENDKEPQKKKLKLNNKGFVPNKTDFEKENALP